MIKEAEKSRMTQEQFLKYSIRHALGLRRALGLADSTQELIKHWFAWQGEEGKQRWLDMAHPIKKEGK
jgi:hypothetical protein